MKSKLQHMLKVEQFFEVSFIRQFALAFILMSLVPIVFLMYIVHNFGLYDIIEKQIPFFRIAIVLIVLLSLAAYDIIRRNMVALYLFVKYAQEVLNTRLNKKVNVRSTGDIKKTITIFNKLLEKNSNELEK